MVSDTITVPRMVALTHPRLLTLALLTRHYAESVSSRTHNGKLSERLEVSHAKLSGTAFGKEF